MCGLMIGLQLQPKNPSGVNLLRMMIRKDSFSMLEAQKNGDWAKGITWILIISTTSVHIAFPNTVPIIMHWGCGGKAPARVSQHYWSG